MCKQNLAINKKFFKINKIENEIEQKAINGCFIPIKCSSFNFSNCQTNCDRLREFIEIKLKVVSTQLTQNGKMI